MIHQSPAELHEEAVNAAVEEYRWAFNLVFADRVQKGQVPGTTAMSDEELHALFRAWPQETWRARAAQDPAGTLRLLRQYAQLEERGGVAG